MWVVFAKSITSGCRPMVNSVIPVEACLNPVKSMGPSSVGEFLPLTDGTEKSSE